MTIMIPYGVLFEENSLTETRDVTFTRHPLIPDDSYAFPEYYCPDPICDCQMVMIGVLSKKQAAQIARFTYLFDPKDQLDGEPNPNLDYGEQSIDAKYLLAWFTDHLQDDQAYRDRLKRHYHQVKEATANPEHPAHAKYLNWKATLPFEDDLEGEMLLLSKRRKKPAPGKAPLVPVAMRPLYGEIVELTDCFCHERLNEEYRDLCRKMAAALVRKRPSPLNSGKASIWAAGVIYALCQINFGFDKSQTSHIRHEDIAVGFDVRQATASQKASAIRKILKTYIMDPEWTLASRIDDNPLAWQIMVDGFVLDARYAPIKIQIEAYQKGLIPYIPGIKK